MDFYDLTIDEALIAYRAKVDEWRFFRNGFNLLHCSFVGKDRAEITDVMPLPFDNEIVQETDLFEEYRKYQELNGGQHSKGDNSD